MSGRKTTNILIDSNELSALRRQASQASSLSQCNRALQQLSDRNQRYLDQQQNRITALNNTINGLNRTIEQQSGQISAVRQQLRAQLQQVVQSTNQALQQMNEQNYRQMSTLSRNLSQDLARQRQETRQAIEASNHQMRQAMQAAAEQVQQQLNTVSARVSRVEQQIQNNADQIGILISSNDALLDMAREYTDFAATLNADTAANYRTELLLPGRLAAVRTLVTQAQNDIALTEKQPTNAPVARQNARVAAEAAMQLHEDIVRAEQEWQARYQAAACALNGAAAQIEAGRTLRIPDGQGSTVELDGNFWSNGDLDALSQRRDSLEQQLQQANGDGLTCDQLEGLRQAGEQLTSEAVESAEFAVVAAAASQERADTADDLAVELQQRLVVTSQEYGYQNGDCRGAHRLHLRNPDTGFEMVITQSPEVSEDGTVHNHLETDILNYGTNNEEEGREIALEALGNLNGLTVDSVQTVPGFENRVSDQTQRADMQTWARTACQKLPAPVHQQQTATASQPQTAPARQQTATARQRSGSVI